MDMERYVQELQNGKNGAALKKLTESEAGEALLRRFDGREIEKAAMVEDSETLSRLLQGVLSTPEGARFAEQVKKAVNGGGR